VTLKENADEAELKKAKDQSKEQGGEIKHEFSLIKGFTYAAFSLYLLLFTSALPSLLSLASYLPTYLPNPLPFLTYHINTSSYLIYIYHSVEFPHDKVNALQTNEHIHVEQDGEVKTQ
jgi:hypothetical protein